MKLSDRQIAALTLPPGKREALYFDDDVPGFALRLRASGASAWIFQYRIGAKQRRMTIVTARQLNEKGRRLDRVNRSVASVLKSMPSCSRK